MAGALRTATLIASPRRFGLTARNLLLWRRVQRTPEAFAIWRKYFDPEQYLAEHPDVARADVDPAIHFLLYGNEEFRNPSFEFDTRRYLDRHPDVGAAGINALLHFAAFGQREGRTIRDPDTDLSVPPTSEMLPSISNTWRRDFPLVTVVIPCFNYGHFLDQAIQSVLNQTYQDLEIIVVEGGSTDPSSVAEARRLDARGVPKTRFVFRAERHLAGDNRNFGISLARGRYICCLDADDTLRAVYLEVAVFLAEVFGFDLVTPSVQCFGGSEERWLLPDPSFPAILDQNQVSTVALFRRSCWAHAGGFRDWGLGGEHVPEDWDFWIRLLGHGFAAKSIRETLMLYRVHNQGLTGQTRLQLGAQRDLLRRANADLGTGCGNGEHPPRSVANPWANLSAVGDTPGFLIALPFVSIGGAEKLLRSVAERIVARGRRLIVTTSITLPPSIPDESATFEQITPHVYRMATLFSTDQARYQWVRYLIQRYSVQHMMLVGSEVVYRLLPALKAEYPHLNVVDQLFNDEGHVGNNRRYASSIDATIVPSGPTLKSLVEQHGADPAGTYVIPHGIALPTEASEAPPHPLPAAARGKTLIGFFGRLSKEKGADIFIKIVRELARNHDLFFIMTGEGPEQKSLLAQIREYGLEDRIYAPGFVDQVEPLMRAADIVVLPSRLDGMPLAILEAGALGKPVVASIVGSVPTVIEDQVSGLLCDIEDVSAFSRAILRLAGDPELRQRMGAAAREKVTRQYGLDRMLEAYEQLFWPSRKAHSSGHQ
jgi:O-antigen biosynthesis protein